MKFEIPTVINLNQFADGIVGSWDFSPDDQMPGIPGTSGSGFGDDGIDAEIRTFAELPAGITSLGVTCQALFRSHGGYINSIADRTYLGEDLGLQNRVTIMKIFVETAGVYPIRIIYQARAGAANIEVFTVKGDGTKVLLGDFASGGLKTYRVGVVPTFQPALTIVRSGSSVVISWPANATGFTLRSSDTVNGVYTAVTGVTGNSYTTTPTGRKFYLLKK